MKNIILLIGFIILAFSCEKGKYYIYTVKNESGKTIKIKAYKKAYPSSDIPNIINLNVGEELTKTYQDALPPSGYNFVASYKYFETYFLKFKDKFRT